MQYRLIQWKQFHRIHQTLVTMVFRDTEHIQVGKYPFAELQVVL